MTKKISFLIFIFIFNPISIFATVYNPPVTPLLGNFMCDDFPHLNRISKNYKRNTLTMHSFLKDYYLFVNKGINHFDNYLNNYAYKTPKKYLSHIKAVQENLVYMRELLDQIVSASGKQNIEVLKALHNIYKDDSMGIAINTYAYYFNHKKILNLAERLESFEKSLMSSIGILIDSTNSGNMRCPQ